jgi:hypothetical protein
MNLAVGKGISGIPEARYLSASPALWWRAAPSPVQSRDAQLDTLSHKGEREGSCREHHFGIGPSGSPLLNAGRGRIIHRCPSVR